MTHSCYVAVNATCAKAAWSACGYGWLLPTPVASLWCFWLLGGGQRLLHVRTSDSGLEFDVTKIHDPLAQGKAVALSQRKSSTTSRRRLQRYMKLGAMWAEWPSLSHTPLTIAFKVAGGPPWLNPLYFSLNFPYEASNVVLVLLCTTAVLLLWLGKRITPICDLWRKKYLYPMVFDVLYIPLTSTLVRLATCPDGYVQFVLPGGATCACIDHFGYFWGIGLSGFVALYLSALHYKLYTEPLATTMDFRFQTSFQIIMVMARTLNPIVSMLVSQLDIEHHPAIGSGIALGFLLCMTLLFCYNYKVQPCIGSGRLPNNIRALTFSSAMYASLCVLAFVGASAPIRHLYYALTPLPLLWLGVWRLNNRRALQFHIPDKSILGLLSDASSSASRAVGTIAALYMDPSKLHATQLAAVVDSIEKIAQGKELRTRVHALRILWFLHLKSFCKQRSVVGELRQDMIVPPELFLKDKDNKDRSSLPRRAGTSVDKAIKLRRHHTQRDAAQRTSSSVTDLHSSRSSRLWSNTLSLARLVAPSMLGRGGSTAEVVGAEYDVARFGGKQWISRSESGAEAVAHWTDVFDMALNILTSACVARDRSDMHEIALFLLQWYQTRYLRLSKPVFLQVLSALCASTHLKTAADATHSLFDATMAGHLPLGLWLRNASYLQAFSVALDHSSEVTVHKCAMILTLVVQAADAQTNPFVLVTPETIDRIQRGLTRWHAVYRISSLLEVLCLRLVTLEVHHERSDLVRRNWKRQASGVATWLQQLTRRRVHGHSDGSDRSVLPSQRRSVSRHHSIARGKSDIHAIRLARSPTLSRRTSAGSVAPDTSFTTARASTPSCTITTSSDTSSKHSVLALSASAIPLGLATERLPRHSNPGSAVGITHEKHATRRHVPLLGPTVGALAAAGPSVASLQAAVRDDAAAASTHTPSPPTHTLSMSSVEPPRPNDLRVDYLLDNMALRSVSKHGRWSGSDKFTFVPPAILAEVERRRSTRRQFLSLLHQAVGCQVNQRPHDFCVAISNLALLYTTADACALGDFLETELSPELRAFFHMHVTPVLALATAATSRRRRWPWGR
ncbi:hypothetical protein SDRG_02609 [Saprolegnia diclina VS20]|uniref:Uncharacterized protein n=1 Tax=Saprolegnia diclina (strain VS20) TaxID=1156394 RepID=T0QPE2_SAPDV|nr:hypothetical protein SDRG_02609 [Saprolegnia diclina VS20]EQC39954.1 hypothetical protein SDRG_02609 [Saprolegnia diclina VS20]|eukprot:XP_008606428.1 hypothetical protein SDRG_02609 [Saprolegnia diclina VS20]